MNVNIPHNFIEEFFNRTILFSKYSIGSGKDLEYLNRLRSAEVAITGSKEILQTFNGQHMILMVANLLSRTFFNIDLIIPSDIKTEIRFPFVNENDLSICLENLCRKINPCLKLGSGNKQKRYDIVVAIGSIKRDLGNTIIINSDGWIAYANAQDNSFCWISENANPIGASETKDQELVRVKWYTNFALFNRRGLARLPSINN